MLRVPSIDAAIHNPDGDHANFDINSPFKSLPYTCDDLKNINVVSKLNSVFHNLIVPSNPLHNNTF